MVAFAGSRQRGYNERRQLTRRICLVLWTHSRWRQSIQRRSSNYSFFSNLTWSSILKYSRHLGLQRESRVARATNLPRGVEISRKGGGSWGGVLDGKKVHLQCFHSLRWWGGITPSKNHKKFPFPQQKQNKRLKAIFLVPGSPEVTIGRETPGSSIFGGKLSTQWQSSIPRFDELIAEIQARHTRSKIDNLIFLLRLFVKWCS